jgi:hypothetical protein
MSPAITTQSVSFTGSMRSIGKNWFHPIIPRTTSAPSVGPSGCARISPVFTRRTGEIPAAVSPISPRMPFASRGPFAPGESVGAATTAGGPASVMAGGGGGPASSVG